MTEADDHITKTNYFTQKRGKRCNVKAELSLSGKSRVVKNRHRSAWWSKKLRHYQIMNERH